MWNQKVGYSHKSEKSAVCGPGLLSCGQVDPGDVELRYTSNERPLQIYTHRIRADVFGISGGLVLCESSVNWGGNQQLFIEFYLQIIFLIHCFVFGYFF